MTRPPHLPGAGAPRPPLAAPGRRPPATAALAGALAVAVLLGAAPARAVEVTTPGPLRLQPDERGYVARFTVKHPGPARTKVRLALPSGPRPLEPRDPPGLTVGFADAAESATLGPGEEREVTVRWLPPPRLRSPVVYTAVEVSSADGAPPRWVGVQGRATPRPALDAALPGALLLWPLLCLALALLRPALARGAARAAALGAAALAGYGWLTVDATASRLDGNGGAAWLARLELAPGLELAAGADAQRLLVVALGALALAAAAPVSARPRAVLGVFAASVALTLGFDVLTLGAGWVLLWGALLAAAPGARRLAAVAALAVAGVLVGLGWFALHAHGALALGGGPVARSTALLELVQLGWLARAEALGGPAVRLAALAVLGGLALAWLLAALPRWLPGASAAPRAPAAHDAAADGLTDDTLLVLLGAAAPATGVVLVRVLGALAPETLAWMAPGLGALGAGGVALGALALVRARDAQAEAAALTGVLSALGALGLAARTSSGTAATLAASHAMAVVAVLLLGARPWPQLARGAAGALTLLVGVLALAGAWPRHPVITGVALLGWGGVLAALLASLARPATPAAGEAGGGQAGADEPWRGRAAAVALVAALLGLAFPRLWLAALDAPALDHLERVDPSGPTQLG